MKLKHEYYLRLNEKPKPYFAQCSPDGMLSKHFYHIADARKWLAANGGGAIKRRLIEWWEHVESVNP